MIKKLILLLNSLLVGCSTFNAPIDSKIGLNPNTGMINLALPKDASWSWLDFHHKIINPTNGMIIGDISLVISNGLFKNNPAVMDAKTAHDVGIINAVGNQINTSIQSAANGAVKEIIP